VPLVDTKALDAPRPRAIDAERLRKTKNLEILRGFAANAAGSKPIALRFLFKPAQGDQEWGDYDLVVTCIGYSGARLPKGDSVFPVGWAKRGPSGTIPTNRGRQSRGGQQVACEAEGSHAKRRCRSAAGGDRYRGWHLRQGDALPALPRAGPG